MTVKNKNIPDLRFKEFKDAWKLEILDSIANVTSGGTPSRSIKNYWDGNIPWVSTSLIDFNVIHNCDEFITQEGVDNSSAKIFPVGTILMAMYGQGKTRGKVAILGIEATTNQACAAIIAESNINTDFLYQNLAGRYEEIRNLSNEGGQQNLSGGIIKEIKISFPTLPEQQKIASFLSSIDEKIQQLTRKKELLEQYKKGVMQQLFSGKLRFKPEKGKAYPEWEEKRLGDVAEIIGGGTPDTLIPEYWDGDIQWYTPTEISERFVSKSKRMISRLGLEKSSAKLLPIGTILFTSRATIAELSFAKEECTTNQGFQSLVVNSDNNPEFIFYWIKNNKKAFIRKSQGSTFLEISKTEMVKINILSPCIEEQQKVANYLSAIDTKIESVANQITQSQTFKKGLLQGMFV